MQSAQACAASGQCLTCLAVPKLGAAEEAPAASGAPPAADASLCCCDAGRPLIADNTALPPAFGSLIFGGPDVLLPWPPSFTLKRGLGGSAGALPGRLRPGLQSCMLKEPSMRRRLTDALKVRLLASDSPGTDNATAAEALLLRICVHAANGSRRSGLDSRLHSSCTRIDSSQRWQRAGTRNGPCRQHGSHLGAGHE